MKKLLYTLILMSTVSVTLSTAVAGNGSIVGYDKKLHRIETNLKTRIATASARSDSWFHQAQLAAAYLDRAQLTGRFGDYVLAREAIDRASELAEPGAGPKHIGSRFNFSTHRLEHALKDLLVLEDSLLVDEQTRVHIDTMRADIHFQRGEYAQAYVAYRQLEKHLSSAGSAVRLAFYYAALGQYDDAESWLDHAEARADENDEHLQAWLKLQHGIVDLNRGRLDEAKAHYLAGLKIFPDYWLIQEHIAEIDALKGHDMVAENSYRDLIERTDSPLFMLALSDILRERMSELERNESVMWRERAENIYRARLRQFPEVVAGHSLDFFIEHAEPEFALSLAQRNYNERPNGEAAVQLMQAYLIVGDTEKVKPVLQRALQSGYTSADLHSVAGRLYTLMDDGAQADYHHAMARRINPLQQD